MKIKNWKKKFYICKDDYNKNIYAGDIVEIYCPMELNTPWTSIVYWDMLHGAWIDSHPIHKKMFGNTNKQRELYPLINQNEISYYRNDEIIKEKGYCKKIKNFYE